MFENIVKFLKKLVKSDTGSVASSKDAAKERLHLVLIQDRASVSADFLEVMKQEIIEVIKKYIDIDESAIDVRLTNNTKEDGTVGAPALYANFPITNVKVKNIEVENKEKQESKTEKSKKPAPKVNKDKKETPIDAEKDNKTDETDVGAGPVSAHAHIDPVANTDTTFDQSEEQPTNNQPEAEIEKAVNEIIETNNQTEEVK